MPARRTTEASQADEPLDVAIVPESRADGADRPENRTATGQVVAPRETIIGTDIPIVADPTIEGTEEHLREQRQVKVLEREKPKEEERRGVALPDNAFESAAFRAANSAARDAFRTIVRRPGSRFVDHGGRYVNIFDLEEVYDVEPNSVVPDGLFLFPTNYLERDLDDATEREARVR